MTLSRLALFSVLLIASAAFTVQVAPSSAHASPSQSVGGHEGEIDMNSHVTFQLGQMQPTERPTTWQEANTKVIEMGAGYTVGKLGPFKNFYVRLEGGYVTSAEEMVTNPHDDLPIGEPFFEADRGGFASATVAGYLTDTPRFSFGLFLEGTAPITVSLEKFSHKHMHYVGGGAKLDVWLTERDRFIRVAYSSRLFLGSGAYQDGAQHNAQLSMSNLFLVEAARWVLPWRMGVRVGPYLEGDINEHVNTTYHEAYAKVTPDFANGDRVRSMRFAVTINPYVCITDNAALEFSYLHDLFGYDSQSTQRVSAGVRTAF